MGGQSSAGFTAIPIDDVDYARREASLGDELGEDEYAEWRLLCGLEHNCISTSERRPQFPGCHGQRIVPWNDLGHDADRLTDGVRKFLRRGVDRLPECLVGPAAVVTDGRDGLGEVFFVGDMVRFPCLIVSGVVDLASEWPGIPLSQASMEASNSLFCSIKSASLAIIWPRSVAGRSFHDGCSSAALAAWTARSTSSALAACTVAIGLSVLQISRINI